MKFKIVNTNPNDLQNTNSENKDQIADSPLDYNQHIGLASDDYETPKQKNFAFFTIHGENKMTTDIPTTQNMLSLNTNHELHYNQLKYDKLKKIKDYNFTQFHDENSIETPKAIIKLNPISIQEDNYDITNIISNKSPAESNYDIKDAQISNVNITKDNKFSNIIDLDPNLSDINVDATNNKINNELNDYKNNDQQIILENMDSSDIIKKYKLYMNIKNILPAIKKIYIYIYMNITCIIFIILGLYMIIPSINREFKDLVNYYYKFNNIRLITDISIVSTYDVCNLPNEFNTIGYYNGINHGCHCISNTNNTLTKDYNGQCINDDLLLKDYTCIDIMPIHPFNIRKWNNQIFCIRKTIHPIINYFKSINYANNDDYNKYVNDSNSNINHSNDIDYLFDKNISNNTTNTLNNQECNNQHKKKCIISKNGNFVCIDRYEFCPLTQIYLQNLSNTEELHNNASTSQTEHSNGLKSKLLVQKSQHYYLTGIQNIMIDYINASNMKPYHIKQSPGYYELMQNINKEDNETYNFNSSFELMDIIDEYKLVQENNLKNESAINIQTLKSISNLMGLYSIKADFLEYCKFDDNFNPYLIALIFEQWTIIKALLFYTIIGILTLLFMNIGRTFALIYIKDQNQEKRLQQEEMINKPNMVQYYTKIIFSILNILIKYPYLYIVFEVLLILYTQIFTMNEITKAIDIMKNWNKLNCIKNELQLDANNMLYYFVIFKNYSIVLIIIISTMILIEIILFNMKIRK